ncbi:hypothetical protein BM536_034650 [Streptomyces phaeoluteigriseus]|uniref:DUF4352 domain-containing protein n=1 Tax=Streptomyces phaeoluteigriseus TaxID=114686 RepID=A0A1V6MIE7_9ACTN|nr:hypothetical protein [Streptomyces phaeoluteigriseus]OQD52165.1 hypothetical protein BM536_034650 [Streptomyces phaeoluteigriseus]
MIVIVVVVLAVASGDGDETTTSAPSKAATERTPQETSSQDKTREPQGERADLTAFQLDDRSQAGITNIWVVWTIKNSSSEKSDYSWDWEAVEAGGTRLTNGSQLETDVRPGQTVRGEYPTTLESVKGVKLNITSFNRTVSY